MKRLALTLALVLFAGPAASSSPCGTNYQTGEHRVLELMSVTVNGEPLTDLSLYGHYTVSIKAEVVRQPVNEVVNYVRFKAHRSETQANGHREQLDEWHEYYPGY
jgi:hypothetical protein